MQKIIVAGMISLLLAACGSPSRIQESATSIPQRDLTLTPTGGSTSQFASRIELGVPAREVRQTRALRAAPQGRVERVPDAPAAAPTPISVAVVAPAPDADAHAPPPPDATGRELAPGATVTVIPVSTSSGSSGGGTDWSEIPAPREGGTVMIGGGHGGRCQGRGRGPVSILR